MTPRRWLVRSWLGGLAVLLLLLAGGAEVVLAGCRPGQAGQASPSSGATDPGLDATGSATDAPQSPSRPPAAAPMGSGGAGANSGPTDWRYVFPVRGEATYARTHHDYPASDIMANCGLPVVAVTDGVVLEISKTDRFDKYHPRGQDKGGLFVSIMGDDGVRYYGAHLSAVGDDIAPGVRVVAGQQLGQVGTTGNSGACHLHFAISPPCSGTGDWWTRRGVLFPWRYLEAWQAGTALSPVSEVNAWQQIHGCPTSAPDNI